MESLQEGRREVRCYEHDPDVRPVAVGSDVFVPIESIFQLLEN